MPVFTKQFEWIFFCPVLLALLLVDFLRPIVSFIYLSICQRFCSCPALNSRYNPVLWHANVVDGTGEIPTLISSCRRAHHQIIS